MNEERNITEVDFDFKSKTFYVRNAYTNKEATQAAHRLTKPLLKYLLDFNYNFNKLVKAPYDTPVLLSADATSAVDTLIGTNRLLF